MSELIADDAAAGTRAWHAGWLYGPGRDLTLVLVPIGLTLASAALMSDLETGTQEDLMLRSRTMWIAQFLLGSTCHIALTFLLVGTRRDLVEATPRQARIVRYGSAVVFAVMLGLYWLSSRVFPAAGRFAVAATTVFAQHHLLSQAKGYWSLYGLRAARDGVARIGDEERQLQQLFVPLALLLTMIRVLFVPLFDDPRAPPYVGVIVGEPAILPFAVVYGLAAVWAVYSVRVLRAVTRGPARHGARALYVTVHLASIGLLLVSIRLGVVLGAGLHGLEYYFITERMLGPAPGDPPSRLQRVGAVPLMLLSMLPVFVLGVARNPWRSLNGGARVIEIAVIVLSALTMTHYFIDAFLYRFRIPAVRAAALRRLGFGA
jgi:hypothetical protein